MVPDVTVERALDVLIDAPCVTMDADDDSGGETLERGTDAVNLVELRKSALKLSAKRCLYAAT
jgi:hypothetical protein